MNSPDSYDSNTFRGDGPVYTRVYLPRGRLAHLRSECGSMMVLCLRLQWRLPDEWLGTGNQDEYDRAAELSLCPACFAMREQRLPDPRLGTGHGREMT